MMKSCTRWLVVTMFVGSGCATERGLQPWPGVELHPHDSSAAVTQRRGIELVVDGDAWDGRPRNLVKDMTPVRVVIRNKGTTPVLIQHKSFFLDGVTGPRQVQAHAPFTIDHAGPGQAHIVPAFRVDGFYLADYLQPIYGPAFPLWPDTIAYEPHYYRVTWRPRLPSLDMLKRALPEGVLDSGGEVAGFVYFPGQPQPQARVLFRVELQAPRTGQDLAIVEIPFRAK